MGCSRTHLRNSSSDHCIDRASLRTDPCHQFALGLLSTSQRECGACSPILGARSALRRPDPPTRRHGPHGRWRGKGDALFRTLIAPPQLRDGGLVGWRVRRIVPEKSPLGTPTVPASGRDEAANPRRPRHSFAIRQSTTTKLSCPLGARPLFKFDSLIFALGAF